MDIRIPGYDIVREARRGGQGVIFQALQRSTNRKVAIKVLLDGALSDEKTVERFKREVEIVAELRHPNIVVAFDSGATDEGHPYFVMDFVYGHRLNEFVRSKKLGVREILELFANICDGVSYAHQRGIIHRDLKPANIIIDSEGRPRVLDFGLARRADGHAQSVTSISAGILGTLAYMSPEQVRGQSAEIDVRTDVYSLGVILYELLAGKLPYLVDTDLTVAFENIASADPAPIDSSVEGSPASRDRIPSDLDTIVRKALSKNPDRRYENAGKFAEDLRGFLTGKPISARRDSNMYILMTTLRRHRGPVIATGMFVLLLIAWATTISVLYAREQRLTEKIKAESSEAASQRDRAVTAESDATERFEAVREMATDLLFEAHDRVAPLAGSTPARSLVVATAMKYLEDLQRDAADDSELQREVAAGFVRLGNVQGGLGVSNLGDTDGAMTSYRRALEMCKSALKSSPDDRRWQKISADAESRLAGLHFSQGNSKDAIDLYESAMLTIRRLMNSDADDTSLREEYAYLLQRIGNVQAAGWEMEVARRHYDESARIFGELAASAPTEPRFRRELAMVQLRIVRTILVANESDEDAMPFVDRAIDLLRTLVGEHPQDAAYARDLTIALDHKADVLLRHGAQDDAITCLLESRDISQRLADLDPENVQARRDLVISHNDLGRALLSAHRTADAMNAYRGGLAIAEALLAEDPKSAINRRDVAHGHDNLAQVFAEKGDVDAAIESLTRSIEAYESLYRNNNEDFSVLRDAAIAHYGRGEHYMSIAADDSNSIDRRTRCVADARNDYLEYRKAITALRDRGRLDESELRFFDRANSKIEACDRLASALREQSESTPKDSD